MPYTKWTVSEIQFLQKYYGVKQICEISEELQRTPDSIVKKAKRLNLTTPMKKWSVKEEEYLIEKWGLHSIKTIAKTLNRSHASIKKKAFELQLGPSRIGNGEFLTTGDIGYLLNKDPNLIYRWVRDGYIKGRRFGEKKVFQIRPKHFVLFLKEHPEKWNALQARIDLIKGYLHTSFNLPDWFENKLYSDRSVFMSRRLAGSESYYSKYS
ncbi:hypothetical protein CACET_c06700 [Clostridium aceticum]|uniref:Uncharacterized protein n=1 Tax=Clostridium aceticum TaxID=84022 RepID=A0A0D8IES6_9CLOT|nr:hypothetical protein [Clostridium aceticum]AKL94180.1 hypothetical protein CACET_c06700 [Clostridium aceticum]KJF28477.1 hypothetical protein TZ02_00675 [Clostridium aceticum]